MLRCGVSGNIYFTSTRSGRAPPAAGIPRSFILASGDHANSARFLRRFLAVLRSPSARSRSIPFVLTRAEFYFPDRDKGEEEEQAAERRRASRVATANREDARFVGDVKNDFRGVSAWTERVFRWRGIELFKKKDFRPRMVSRVTYSICIRAVRLESRSRNIQLKRTRACTLCFHVTHFVFQPGTVSSIRL